MRTIEMMVVLAVLPPVFSLLTPGRTVAVWMHWLPFLAAALALAQLLLEGYRWQMLPAYLVVAFLVLYGAGRGMSSNRESFSFGAVALVTWLAAVTLSVVLPVFEFPAPTGPFAVGTEVRHLTDLRRHETLSGNPGAPRELMVQIWYPAEASFRGKLAPYRQKQTTNWRTAQLALVKTNAFLNAPLAAAHPSYPVVLFSPSWSGQRVQNTFQIEELASHGYVIVAMDHPYGTDVTVFPDGRIVRTKLGAGENYSSQEAFDRFEQEADEQVKFRAEDARFVLDKLDEFNRRDPEARFTGRLDLQRVGIFGHSLGGSVAAQACWLDPRFKTALNMDGMLTAESGRDGSPRPIFFMLEDQTLPSRAELPSLDSRHRRAAEFEYAQAAMMQASLSRSGGYRMVIHGTTHRSFSDSPLFSPLRFLTGAGAIPARRAENIINQYTLAFFDQALKGQSEPLLAGLSPEFPEARLEVWNTPRPMEMKHLQSSKAIPVAIQPIAIAGEVDRSAVSAGTGSAGER
jgi:dienelactone hydrolase